MRTIDELREAWYEMFPLKDRPRDRWPCREFWWLWTHPLQSAWGVTMTVLMLLVVNEVFL